MLVARNGEQRITKPSYGPYHALCPYSAVSESFDEACRYRVLDLICGRKKMIEHPKRDMKTQVIHSLEGQNVADADSQLILLK